MGIGRKQAKALRQQKYREQAEQAAKEAARRELVERKKREKYLKEIKIPMPEVLIMCDHCLDEERWGNGNKCVYCNGHKVLLDVVKATDHIDEDLFFVLEKEDDNYRWHSGYYREMNTRGYVRLNTEVIMILAIQDMRNKAKMVEEIHALLNVVKDYLRTVGDFGARVTVNAIDNLLDKQTNDRQV